MSATTCLDDLLDEIPANDFGQAIAASGSTIAVAEPSRSRVHLFRDKASGPTYLGTIEAQAHLSPGPLPGQGFGYALALSGDQLIIGDFIEAPKPLDRSSTGSDGWTRRSGVYIAPARDGASPKPLFPKALPADSIYGYAVALDGDRFALTFRRRDIAGAWHSAIALGSASSSNMRVIPAPAGVLAAEFGHRLVLSQGRLLAAGAGAAFLYAGQDQPRRLPDSGAPPDVLSEDIALAGNLAVLGGMPRGPAGGSALVIDLSDGRSWSIRPSGAVAATHHGAYVGPALPKQLGRGPFPPDATWPPPLRAPWSALQTVTGEGVASTFELRAPNGDPLRSAPLIVVGSHSLLLSIAPSDTCRVASLSLRELH